MAHSLAPTPCAAREPQERGGSDTNFEHFDFVISAAGGTSGSQRGGTVTSMMEGLSPPSQERSPTELRRQAQDPGLDDFDQWRLDAAGQGGHTFSKEDDLVVLLATS